MPNIIINQAVAENHWQLLAKEADSYQPDEKQILPLALWLQQPNRHELAVWLDSDESPEQLSTEDLSSVPLIAINFPVLADGRGFSYGRELRERGFNNELRAVGNFMRDQLYYLQRCGFNSFASENIEPEKALASLDDFTLAYQAAIDQAKPLFKV